MGKEKKASAFKRTTKTTYESRVALGHSFRVAQLDRRRVTALPDMEPLSRHRCVTGFPHFPPQPNVLSGRFTFHPLVTMGEVPLSP